MHFYKDYILLKINYIIFKVYIIIIKSIIIIKWLKEEKQKKQKWLKQNFGL